jgi:hypothetical protein
MDADSQRRETLLAHFLLEYLRRCSCMMFEDNMGEQKWHKNDYMAYSVREGMKEGLWFPVLL